MKTLLVLFLGGGTGSVLRYAVQQFVSRQSPDVLFPLGTFAVNLTGSFLIGLFYALSARLGFSAEMRLLLTTGLCGGFTTFSTFSNDGLQLLRQGNTALFVLYTLSSVLLGLLAVWMGAIIGNKNL